MSLRTFSTSSGIWVWVIRSPLASAVLSASEGMTSSTYFSPNRVLGRIEAVTFFGISPILFGLMPSVRTAPLAPDFIWRTSPTITPRTLTSAREGSWSPTVSVFSLTLSKVANFWVNTALISHTASTSRQMKMTPSRRSPKSFLVISARQPDGGRGAPDGHAQEQVDHVDRHDRGPHGAAHGYAHACRAAAGGVAVVAVDEDDHDGEDQHLAEGPEHVTGWQELVEVVVVGARTLPVELGHHRARREVRRQQAHDVQRHDRDQPADDARGDQEGHRRDRH